MQTKSFTDIHASARKESPFRGDTYLAAESRVTTIADRIIASMPISRTILVCAALSLAACAPIQYRHPHYTHDDTLSECQYNASSATTQNVAANAVAGAVIGAMMARAVGLHGHYVANVAATGAVSGAANAVVYGSAEWQAQVDSCMASNGYQP